MKKIVVLSVFFLFPLLCRAGNTVPEPANNLTAHTIGGEEDFYKDRPGHYSCSSWVWDAVNGNVRSYGLDTLGLAPKANLIGMSWGGFFSTRYAAAYPENVRKIYLDAPLLTFDGFDGGDFGPWKKRDCVWTDDPRMPDNLAASLARTGIPILPLSISLITEQMPLTLEIVGS